MNKYLLDMLNKKKNLLMNIVQLDMLNKLMMMLILYLDYKYLLNIVYNFQHLFQKIV